MDLNLELIGFSFAAGLATFFSPCVGAMLPAYVSLALSHNGPRVDSMWARGRRGLALGTAISAGFLTSFAAIGLLFSAIGSTIARYLPWAAVLIGLGIVALGVWILLRPNQLPSFDKALPLSMRPRADARGGWRSFYVFGLFYAVCAAACTLPIFLSVMTQAFLGGGVVTSLANFIAYGWGMSLMMLGFAVLVAYSQGAVQRWMRSLSSWMPRLGGLFMIAAGGYVLYYLLVYGRYIDLIGR
ncbi:MAG: cytochrome c biogenesis CcdA family protein [Candidatus Bipolaricaulia bacterium]